MALTLVWGQGGLSALSPRLAPILSFYDLLKNGTALPEIETDLPKIETALSYELNNKYQPYEGLIYKL